MHCAGVEDERDLKSWARAIIDNTETSVDWIDFLKAAKEEFSQLDPDSQRDCQTAATALVKLHLLDDTGANNRVPRQI